MIGYIQGMLRRNYSLIIFLFLLSIGCASPQQGAARRYFWPFPPDAPKVEFVGSYWSSDDLPRSTKRKFLGAVAGVERPQGFSKPWGIASNGKGRVYIVDTNMKVIVIYDFNKNSVDFFGMGERLFSAPVGITLDSAENIYVSEPKRNKVYSFSRDLNPLKAIGDDATLNWPVGMAVDDVLGRLYVVNGRGHNIAVFDLEGRYISSIGKAGKEDGEFNFPTDVGIDSKGNLVVADSMNARIQVLDPEGRFIRKFGQRGDLPGDFQVIKGVAVSRDDDIYVVDGKGDKILVFNKEGQPLTVIGGTAPLAETMRLNPGGFFIPQDIDIDENDTIYVVDSMNKRFQVFQIINEEWLKRHPLVE